jgi:hypothetical protein
MIAGAGPANIVRMVEPALIEQRRYEWPWLGVDGDSVHVLLQRANDLSDQWGAARSL